MSCINVFRTRYSNYGIVKLSDIDIKGPAVIIDEEKYCYSACLRKSIVVPEIVGHLNTIKTYFVIKNNNGENCCIVPTSIENIPDETEDKVLIDELDKCEKEISKVSNLVNKYTKELKNLEFIKNRTFEKLEEEISDIHDENEKKDRLSKLNFQKEETAKAKTRYRSLQSSLSRYKTKLNDKLEKQKQLKRMVKEKTSSDSSKSFFKECNSLKKEYKEFYIGILYQGFKYQLDFITDILEKKYNIVILKDLSFQNKKDVLLYCKKTGIEYHPGLFDDYSEEMEMIIPNKRISAIDILSTPSETHMGNQQFKDDIKKIIPNDWDKEHRQRLEEELLLPLNIDNILIAKKISQTLKEKVIVDGHDLLISFLLGISTTDPLKEKRVFDHDYFETVTVYASNKTIYNARNILQDIFPDVTVADVLSEKKEKLNMIIDRVCGKKNKMVYKKIAKKLQEILFDDISIFALIEQAESVTEEQIIEAVSEECQMFSKTMQKMDDYCLLKEETFAFWYCNNYAVTEETVFPVIHFKRCLPVSLFENTLDTIYDLTGNRVTMDFNSIDINVLDTVFYSYYGSGVPFADKIKYTDIWKSNNIQGPNDFMFALKKCTELSSFKNLSLGVINELAKYIYYDGFLKTYYPVYYMCNALNNADRSYYMQLVDECRRIGVNILYPDVNKSRENFSIQDQNIYYGLSNIKGVGQNAKVIIENRTPVYKNLLDFMITNYTLNPDVVRSLIEAGAFDVFIKNRTYLLKKYEMLKSDIVKAGKYTDKLQKAEKSLKEALVFNKSTAQINNIKSEIGYIQCHLDRIMNSIVFENVKSSETSQNYEMERNVLSACLSVHPLDDYIGSVKDTENISMIKQNSNVKIAGTISSLKIYDTKFGKKARFVIEDKTGNVDVNCSSKVYEKFKEVIKNGKVVKIYGYTKQDMDIIVQCNFVAELFTNKKQVILMVEDIDDWRIKILPTLKLCIKDHGREVLVYNKDTGMIVPSNVFVSDSIFDMGYNCAEVKKIIKF